MANSNIVSLTSITVPLAGTEVIPIWDSTTTKKVTISDLTAGRAVLAKSLTLLGTGSGNVLNFQFPTMGTVGGTYVDSASIYFGGGAFAYTNAWEVSHSTNAIAGYVAGVKRIGVDSSGNISASTGNFVPAVSGKGVDYSAKAGAAGMTSKVLIDYEEGTFSPTIIGATTAGVGTYTSQLGSYTKVGRKVTVIGSLGWTAHTGTGNMRLASLPFAAGVLGGQYPMGLMDYAGLTVPVSTIPVLQLSPGSTSAAFLAITPGAATTAALALDTAADVYFSLTYFT